MSKYSDKKKRQAESGTVGYCTGESVSDQTQNNTVVDNGAKVCEEKLAEQIHDEANKPSVKRLLGIIDDTHAFLTPKIAEMKRVASDCEGPLKSRMMNFVQRLESLRKRVDEMKDDAYVIGLFS